MKSLKTDLKFKNRIVFWVFSKVCIIRHLKTSPCHTYLPSNFFVYIPNCMGVWYPHIPGSSVFPGKTIYRYFVQLSQCLTWPCSVLRHRSCRLWRPSRRRLCRSWCAPRHPPGRRNIHAPEIRKKGIVVISITELTSTAICHFLLVSVVDVIKLFWRKSRLP